MLMLLGSSVLLGWLWNIGFLTTVLPGRIMMNIAVGVLFLGLTLILLIRSKKARRTQMMCALSTMVVILVGLHTLSEYVFHADLRLGRTRRYPVPVYDWVRLGEGAEQKAC
jgi:hypothetical protein